MEDDMLIQKNIAFRMDQVLWVRNNIKSREFAPLVRKLLDEYIERENKEVEHVEGRTNG